MRLIHFVIVLIAVLLFLIPGMRRSTTIIEDQKQEQVESSLQEKRFRIIYEVQNPVEEPMADIIWIKKAAEVSRDAGTPYFNIIQTKIRKKFVKRYNMDLSVVEGIIELKEDPLKAEYDAYEIDQLIIEAPENNEI
jgi:hypothetical protein